MTIKKYKDESKTIQMEHAVDEVIIWLLTWCYALSYRDLTEIVAVRIFKLDRFTMYRWVQE